MEVRLCLGWGGDGKTIIIMALNDTGSDLLTLFYADLPFLGNYYQYTGWQQDVGVGKSEKSVRIKISSTITP